jgi:hypothetical protein
MKMIARNRKKADCGVVAAFNAASWCKKNKTYDQIHELALKCGYVPGRGIQDFQFRRLLNKLHVNFKRVRNFNLEEIQSSLYLGKCLVVSYFPTYWPNGHLVTIFMDKSGKIKIVNSDNERMTWNDFAAEVSAGVMERINIYELTSNRNLAL